jgi:hypothetical protein
MQEVKFKDLPVGSLFVTNKNFAYNNSVYEKNSEGTAKHLTWVFFQLRSTVLDFDATEYVLVPNKAYIENLSHRIKALQEEANCLAYIVDKFNTDTNQI